MCTLSWRVRPSGTGYELWFNRDELVTRAPELPPRLWPGNISRLGYLAPLDGARGGTWLAVNERGLTVALLNDYGVAWLPPAPSRSRGDVVVVAASKGGIEDVAETLSVEGLRNTAAFTMIAIEATGERACWHWNGVRLAEWRGKDVPEFFSSSSCRTTEVIAARRAEFERMIKFNADEQSRRMYHFCHDSARGAESVLMCRPDANTRSVVYVSADGSEVVLEYVPVTRGETGPELGAVQCFRLPRANARAGAGESK